MSAENPNFDFLEPFKHPKFPFLYIVSDLTSNQKIYSLISQEAYGLEKGFGAQPSRVFLFDNSIPWILTENNAAMFYIFSKSIDRDWNDIDFQKIQIHKPIIALYSFTPSPIEQNARVLFYRNINHVEMSIIPFDKLKTGQRVIFTVNEEHAVSEIPNYREYLSEFGYDPNLLQIRSKHLPSITKPTDIWNWKNEFVLDITK